MDVRIHRSVLVRTKITHYPIDRYGMVHEEHRQRTVGRQQGVDMLVPGDDACLVIWYNYFGPALLPIRMIQVNLVFVFASRMIRSIVFERMQKRWDRMPVIDK